MVGVQFTAQQRSFLVLSTRQQEVHSRLLIVFKRRFPSLNTAGKLSKIVVEIKRQYFCIALLKVLVMNRKASQHNNYLIYHFHRISIKNQYISVRVTVLGGHTVCDIRTFLIG